MIDEHQPSGFMERAGANLVLCQPSVTPITKRCSPSDHIGVLAEVNIAKGCDRCRWDAEHDILFIDLAWEKNTIAVNGKRAFSRK